NWRDLVEVVNPLAAGDRAHGPEGGWLDVFGNEPHLAVGHDGEGTFLALVFSANEGLDGIVTFRDATDGATTARQPGHHLARGPSQEQDSPFRLVADVFRLGDAVVTENARQLCGAGVACREAGCVETHAGNADEPCRRERAEPARVAHVRRLWIARRQ